MKITHADRIAAGAELFRLAQAQTILDAAKAERLDSIRFDALGVVPTDAAFGVVWDAYPELDRIANSAETWS